MHERSHQDEHREDRERVAHGEIENELTDRLDGGRRAPNERETAEPDGRHAESQRDPEDRKRQDRGDADQRFRHAIRIFAS